MNEEQRPMDENEEPQLTNEAEQERQHQEHEQPPRPRPRIYVASLSDYNAGRLHGEWIDAAQSAEELHGSISAMLAASPEPLAEEWAIHDYEGFGPLRLSEYESIADVATVARGITEHGPAFAAWAVQVGLSESEELERFGECFIGHFESVEEYAEEYADVVGISDAVDKAAGSLAPYVRIDTEALGRDMVLGGDVSIADAPDGGVFLFWQ